MNAYFFIFTFMLCYNNTLIVTRKRKKKNIVLNIWTYVYFDTFVLSYTYAHIYNEHYTILHKNQIALGKKTAHPKEYFRLSSYITDGNTIFFSLARGVRFHITYSCSRKRISIFAVSHWNTNIIVMCISPFSYRSYVVQ